MMKKQLFYIFFSFVLFASCTKNNCSCYKTLGFKEVNVKWKSNDSLVASKRFYYQKKVLFKMETIQDSANNFMWQHYSDSVIFKQFDSIYFDDQIRKISHDETNNFLNNGYECVCND